MYLALLTVDPLFAESKAQSSSGDSFLSAAGNPGMPVGFSVDHAMLKLRFNLSLATLKSKPISQHQFSLGIVNSKSMNSMVSVLDGLNLSFNIPYIESMGEDTKTKENLYLFSNGGDSHSFTMDAGNTSPEIKFYYNKLENFKITPIKNSSTDAEINGFEFIATDGSHYIFEQDQDQDRSYYYKIISIISNIGEKINFSYSPDNGKLTSIFNDANDLFIKVAYGNGSVSVRYKDLQGEDREVQLIKSTGNLKIINALNEEILVAYNGGNINSVSGPDGTLYSASYDSIDNVTFEICDGGASAKELHCKHSAETVSVKQKHSFVNKITKTFNNLHFAPQEVSYGVSKEGNNFLGNNISCFKDTFDSLNPLQDWMIQCSFDNPGYYKYQTSSTVTASVFQGSNKPSEKQITSTFSYNSLHLSVNQAVFVKSDNLKRHISYGESSYSSKTDPSYIGNANNFANLGFNYNKVKETHSYLCQIDSDCLYDYVSIVSAASYYKEEEGNAPGQISSSLDHFGNYSLYKYAQNPEQYNNFSALPERVEHHLINDVTSVVDYPEIQWLTTAIEVNNKSYNLSTPTFTKTAHSINDRLISTGQVNYHDVASNLSYGYPKNSNSIDNFNQQNAPYSDHGMLIEKMDNGNYVLSSKVTSQIQDFQGVAPGQLLSTKKTYNSFGGLIKLEDPNTGDITLYDHYDPLGRITQISYLPSGNESNKQVYQFLYSIKKDDKSSGYVLTSVTQTPQTGYESIANKYDSDTILQAKGYKSQKLYSMEGKVISSYSQTKDSKEFFITNENFYDNVDRRNKTVSYYYDESEVSHPHATNYYYNEKGAIAAVQSPLGSTQISITQELDDSKNVINRNLSYALIPTEKDAGSDSLCFDAINSTALNMKYKSCRIAMVHVSEGPWDKTGSNRFAHKNSYDYGIIMDADYKVGQAQDNFYNGEGAKYKTLIESVEKPLSDGESLGTKDVLSLADRVKQDCLSGQCYAQYFHNQSYNAYGSQTATKDLVSKIMTTYQYDAALPTRMVSKTVYNPGDSNSNIALKTRLYSYDNYGNITEINSTKGDGTESKTLIGKKEFTALGFQLGQTSLLNNSNYVKMAYNDIGQLIKSTDLLGNTHLVTYDPLWKKKLSTVVTNSPDGKQNSSENYTYNEIGEVTQIKKQDATKKNINTIDLTYEDATSLLSSTTTTYENGDTRTRKINYNKYNVPTDSNYLRNGEAVYTLKSSTNKLGLPKETTYSGNIIHSKSYQYSTDLLIKETSVGDQSYQYTYDELNKPIEIKNIVFSAPVRTYAYTFNRLGQKASRSAITEVSNKTDYLYSYTDWGQISQFSCVSADSISECPRNMFGDEVKNITYRYDTDQDSIFPSVLGRITSVTEETVNGTLNQTYDYANTDPTQLSSIGIEKVGDITLKYDDNGDVITYMAFDKDKKAFTYDITYNADRRITLIEKTLSEPKTKSTVGYEYGLGNNLTKETFTPNIESKSIKEELLIYGPELVTVKDTRLMTAEGAFLNNKYVGNLSDLYNVTGSVLEGKIKGDLVYMPFGLQSDLTTASATEGLTISDPNRGYRKMLTDKITGWQFLGGGYRAYNPTIRVFMKKDIASPFGAGGINGYIYATNDPVNAFDPTGLSTNKDIGKANVKLSAAIVKAKEAADKKAKQLVWTELEVVGFIFLGLAEGGAGFGFIPSLLADSVIQVGLDLVEQKNLGEKFDLGNALEDGAENMAFGMLASGVGHIVGYGIGKLMKRGA
ncbi:MAG: RHS repeat-associated protein, partial [Saprospiraceae bacterium]